MVKLNIAEKGDKISCFINIKISWPEYEEPNWYVDLIIANEIISPILTKYESMIKFWRFHRRADRRSGRHIFSFYFIAEKQICEKIKKSIKEKKIFKELINEGLIEKLPDGRLLDAFYKRMFIVAKWPDGIKDAWSYFILGASKTLLRLIKEFYDFNFREYPEEEKPKSIGDMIILYKTISYQLSMHWKEYGNNLYLHHLNSLFAYEPVDINVNSSKIAIIF